MRDEVFPWAPEDEQRIVREHNERTVEPLEPIRLTPEQQACPHDKVKHLDGAMFRCIGPDGGCGAEMVIPEYVEAACRKCDE